MKRQIYGKVRDFVKAEQMFTDVCAVSAAVSGGGDSMAMLDILLRLREEFGFLLRAVHVNHGIRGEAALKDQELTEKICRENGIVCAVYSYDVPAISQKNGTGHEETGRQVRREAFRKEREPLKDITGGKAITAVAHNKNDLAETMLHHLARGTGLRGLAAVKPVSGEIVRPVLCLERREIDEYLRERSLSCATDMTNLEDDYTRNRIRHHIIPVMEQEINERTVSHMAETARLAGMAEEYLSARGRELLETAKKENGTYVFDDSFFKYEKILQNYAVMDAMEFLGGRRKDVSILHVELVTDLWSGRTGASVDLPYGMEAVRTYEGVLLRRKDQKKTSVIKDEEWRLPCPGKLDCPWGTFKTEIFPYSGQKILEKKYTKWLDCDKIKYSVTVRTRKKGDYLIIDTGGNRKKLNRYMIDARIPAEDRDSIPLVTAGSEILWVVGGRMNTGCGITPDTKRVLQIEYQGDKAGLIRDAREYRTEGGKYDE